MSAGDTLVPVMSTPLDPRRQPDAEGGPIHLDAWQAFVAGQPASRSDLARHRAAVAVRAARVPVTITAVVLLLGAPVGLLWARVSPRVSVSFSAQGPSLDRPESSEFFATDGSFGIVLLLVGLATGAVAWRALRGRVQHVGVPVGLAAGALLAGLVAQSVGSRLVVDSRLAGFCVGPDACPLYDGTLQLRARGLVVLWAVAALAVYVGLSLLIDDAEQPPAPDYPAPDYPWAPPTG